MVIDIGEAWAAVLGLKPILAKRTSDATDAQAAAVAKLPETIARRARSLVRGALLGPAVSMADYELILKETSEALDIVHVEAMFRGLPVAAKLAYVHTASLEYAALQNALPKNQFKTAFGAVNLPPDDTRLLAFSELYEALEDPVGYVFAAISDASLPPAVAAGVKAVFPSLSAAISEAIRGASGELKGKDLPLDVETGVGIWLGIPRDAPVPAPEEKPTEEPTPGKGKGDLDKATLTPAGRLEAR